MLLVTLRQLTLGLDRLDASDQPSILPNFARRIETLRLRLETQMKQLMCCFIDCRFELLVAHFAEFTGLGHLNGGRRAAMCSNYVGSGRRT